MGQNKELARTLARLWWTTDAAANSRSRGHGICDAGAMHFIPVGEGYLCRRSAGSTTPDLVCERCFDRLPYEPWQEGAMPALPSDARAQLLLLLLKSPLLLMLFLWHVRKAQRKRRLRRVFIFIACAIVVSLVGVTIIAGLYADISSSTVAPQSDSKQPRLAQLPNKALKAAEIPVMAPEQENADAAGGESAHAAQRVETATVGTVISGDSFWTDKGKKIRLAGIDAPFWSPSKSVTSEPGGVEAYKFTKERVEGFTVNLEFDERLSDQNGYSNAYVFLDDGQMLNSLLLENGLVRVDARAAFQRLGEFMVIEEEARLAKKGIWSSR